MTDKLRDALQHLADWHAHCLNYGKPADQKHARTTPTDDDLCELFNRLDRARRVLAEAPKAGREIAKRIYLTGIRLTGYTVTASGFDGCIDLSVPSVRVGNAIVRALRDEAAHRPDLFPPSKQPRGREP